MTNVSMLKSIVEKKGVKMWKLAEAIHVSMPTLARKLNGESEWMQSEIVAIRDYLSLTDDEITQIFLQ
jgi:transcriptional regulator with XRE-family HTH domain